ncbi:MAG: M16 family metallopeptidase [Bacteroidia bacterium]
MKKTLLISLSACGLFLSFSASAGDGNKAKLVEKVERKGNEIIIPYTRYILPNGLTLIIHEDHSDPMVHVDVMYHVGSDREQEGRSGFAHFFEHMMFQGSEHVGNSQHFKVVNEGGGTLNGNTNTDRTDYFETVPSNQLEKAMWLEADRMGFLLDSVTQQKFEVQRGTVKNERGQRYDNRPYGLVEEKTIAALYPEGHPYSWPTIGFIEDLNRVNVGDLKNFFLRWYGPNNAVLTIAGDVKPEQVIAFTEKYFGPIPRGKDVPNMTRQAAVLDKDRFISYEDRIRNPQLNICWPSVCESDADVTAVEALCSVLSGDKNSVFYQKFVKSQIARNANVYLDARELAGNVRINITAFPGKTLTQIDSMVKTAFTEFEKKGVKEEDILKFKNSTESDLINALSSVQGKASELSHFFTMLGNANYLRTTVESLHKLKKEDVMRVYEKYVKNKPAVYLSVYPTGKPELVAHPDNYTPPTRKTDLPESAEYKGLTYNKPKDTFNRSLVPPAGPAPMVTVPDFWNEKFPNGMKLIGVKNTEIPFVNITISLLAGHRQEDMDKAGIAVLCSRLMNESTTKHTAEEINDQLDMLGSSVTFSSGREDITLNISSLTKNLSATLAIAEEMLSGPKFEAKEFETDKNQILEAIANNSTQPNIISSNVYNKLLYGDQNILSVPELGSEQSVKSITLDDVKKYYSVHYSPGITEVVVVGDVDKADILTRLKFLKEWQNKPVILKEAAKEKPAEGKLKLFLVNKDKAPQSVVQMGELTGLKYDVEGEYFKASTMNFMLGGTFNSRINMDLREKKAWTYGAKSFFSGDKYDGDFTVNAPVRANSTDSTLMDLVSILKNFRDKGITTEELEFTKKCMTLSEALKYETFRDKSRFLKRIMDYNLDKEYVERQTALLNGLTKADLDKIAEKYLNLDQMLILVVGDKKSIYPGLQKLGYEIVELDTNGNPVSGADGEKKEEGPAGVHTKGK